jgi:DNA (cytosine-5)-methyltransferase 1
MNELALFAGAGGGILGGKLLGWRTVCAVEWEPYAASVLVARQNDGFLPPFPIWDDVQTFNGRPWRGIVDVVSGGFPCQDISAAGGAQALKESDQECGEKWQGSFTRYDRDSCSWKTHQCSLLGDLDEFSGTWPRWGLMRNGECWERQMSELRISATESGLEPNNETFFHTPNTTMPCEGTVRIMRKVWLDGEMSLEEASAIAGRDVRKAQGKVKAWPTPVKSDYAARRPSKGWKGDSDLPSVVWTETGGKENPNLPPAQLNADWVEWLMGWPLGWTDLKPLEMDKCHSVQQPHGES